MAKQYINSYLFRKSVSVMIFLSVILAAKGQSCLSTGCLTFTSQYPSTNFTTSSTNWVVITNSSGQPASMNAGNYTLFTVVSGNTYEWSYCETHGGTSTSWDAQLTLFKESNTTTPICFSTDDCGINSNAPWLHWTADFNGTVRILTTMFNGSGCRTNTGSPYNRMAWRIASSCTPVSFTNSNLPQDVSVNEGSSATFTVSVSGTAPYNYYWYKNNDVVVRTTPGSSSTSDSYTIGSVTSSNDGETYKCIISNSCSTLPVPISRNATLTVNTSCTPPNTPPNPNSYSEACQHVIIESQNNVPVNERWYWQGTSCGTRTDLGYANTYIPTTSDRYYIRAYNTVTNCWSDGCGFVDVVVTPLLSLTSNSNSPVTAPAALTLTATTISDATYSWSGPNGYTSIEQNPIRNPTTASMSGEYCVTAFLTGCPSDPSCHQVTINGTPPPSSQIVFKNHNERLVPMDSDLEPEEQITQSVSNSFLKICADGSRATRVKFTNNNPDIPTSNIRFWIESDPFGNNSEITGYFVNYQVNGNIVTADFQHPLYMNLNGVIYKNDAIKIVDFTNAVSIFQKPIRIYRAPILFVHGWRGGETTFELMDNILNQDHYLFSLTHRASYHNESKRTFYDNRNIVSDNLNALFIKSRENNFSFGKATIIAHSMGGVLSRLYLQSGRYKNDIYKLITLNTPHSGSQGANFIYNFFNGACFLFGWLDNNSENYICNPDPAIENMKVNSFAVTNYLNGSGLNRNIVPSFTITTEDFLATDIDCYSLGVLLYSGPNGLYNYELIQSIFDEPNDLVVPKSSQKGGLSKSENFTGQCHLKSYNNSTVIEKVKNLLDVLPNASNFDIDGFNPPVLNSIFLRPPAITNSILSGEISFVSPSNNASFNPGQQITIQTTGSSSIHKTVVGIGNAHIPLLGKDMNSNNSSMLYTIPNEAIGEVRLMCAGYDTVNRVLIDIDTIRIKVNANSVLDSIDTYSEVLRIPVSTQTSLTLKGYFADDIVRDLSESDSAAFLISDTTIARNVYKNTFFGKGIGTTTLNISFRDKIIQLPIEVYQGDNVVSALFNSTTKNICRGESTNFSDLSVGDAIQREWHFPGGTPSLSNDINPIVVYSDTGHFDVTLIANFSGRYDTLTVSNYISVSNKNTTIKSGNWNDPETWGCLTIPSLNDSAIIATGDTIVLDASQQIKRLYIEPGGTLVINDSSKTLIVGNDSTKTSEIVSDGIIQLTNGTLKIYGKLNSIDGSSFDMSGGSLIIDGNTGNELTSVTNGDHLFNIYTNSDKFSLSGGVLQILNPPLGPNSQAINCPYNFGTASTLMLGNGISTTASNNPNGFGGNLLPAEVGKVILDAATSENNRIFRNLNPLTIKGGCEIKSGNLVQEALLKIIDSVDLVTGLAAWYPFNGNAMDESGNGHNGTVTEAALTTDRFGNANSAYSFDGINDSISLNLQQTNLTAYTISAWFKTSIGGPILGGRGNNEKGLTLHIHNNATGAEGKILYVYDSNATSIGKLTDSTFIDNNWHHVVGVFNSSGFGIVPNDFNIYVDGILISQSATYTGSGTAPISNFSSLLIGAHRVWSAGGIFSGKLDDIKIWNRALNQQEISYLF